MKAFLVGQRWTAFVQALYGQATAHYQTMMAGQQHTVPDKALAAFALGGHINLFATWLQSDDRTPPEQMGEYYRRLAAGIMHDLQ
ncbi:hypothetical protein [Lacticaseibacillus camelliae]|uniref:Transcriptional regulator TetR C-terminal Firmicutes type domain-containing protein n=1 Tax=Lacticaseibacillus camelliae DSM 22697 = JCM 13995 TaxID=1423730 RepID=A0A0R2EZ43_9LACO|nr:hypothetical protein FC75_GL002127 [Lacticaseibacillus camelliae DSM 22697 = JCM 13995]